MDTIRSSNQADRGGMESWTATGSCGSPFFQVPAWLGSHVLHPLRFNQIRRSFSKIAPHIMLQTAFWCRRCHLAVACLTHAAQSEHARIPAYSGAGNPIYAKMEWHVSAASRRTTDQSENDLPFKLEDWKQPPGPPVYWPSDVIRHQHETCKVPAAACQQANKIANALSGL